MSILGFNGLKARDLTDFCAEPYTRAQYDIVWPESPEGWGAAYAEYAQLCVHEAIWPGFLNNENHELASGALEGVEGEQHLAGDGLLDEIEAAYGSPAPQSGDLTASFTTQGAGGGLSQSAGGVFGGNPAKTFLNTSTPAHIFISATQDAPSPVPLPASFALLVIGIVAIRSLRWGGDA